MRVCACACACTTTGYEAWWPFTISCISQVSPAKRSKRSEPKWFPAALWKIPALFSLALDQVCLANYSHSPPRMPSDIWCFVHLFLLLFLTGFPLNGVERREAAPCFLLFNLRPPLFCARNVAEGHATRAFLIDGKHRWSCQRLEDPLSMFLWVTQRGIYENLWADFTRDFPIILWENQFMQEFGHT